MPPGDFPCGEGFRFLVSLNIAVSPLANAIGFQIKFISFDFRSFDFYSLVFWEVNSREQKDHRLPYA
jgi:hypothetical protein